MDIILTWGCKVKPSGVKKKANIDHFQEQTGSVRIGAKKGQTSPIVAKQPPCDLDYNQS